MKGFVSFVGALVVAVLLATPAAACNPVATVSYAAPVVAVQPAVVAPAYSIPSGGAYTAQATFAVAAPAATVFVAPVVQSFTPSYGLGGYGSLGAPFFIGQSHAFAATPVVNVKVVEKKGRK